MLYESGQYGKLMTEVALMFANDKFIDKDQLATDVQNVIKLEQTIEKVSFYLFSPHRNK